MAARSASSMPSSLAYPRRTGAASSTNHSACETAERLSNWDWNTRKLTPLTEDEVGTLAESLVNGSEYEEGNLWEHLRLIIRGSLSFYKKPEADWDNFIRYLYSGEPANIGHIVARLTFLQEEERRLTGDPNETCTGYYYQKQMWAGIEPIWKKYLESDFRKEILA